MKMYKIIIVVLCLIGVYALHRSVKQYKEIQEKIEQEHADKVAQEREKSKKRYIINLYQPLKKVFVIWKAQFININSLGIIFLPILNIK